MDPATLALTVTSFLAPYLAKAGGAIMDRAAAGLPDAASHIWDAIAKHFEGNPTAAGAASDLAKNASDQDRQDAFALQLKMALKEDKEFANAIQDLVKQAGGDTDTVGHVSIKTGNVSKSTFVVGNSNDVKNG